MQRYDHYYSLEADGQVQDGHIFCTVAEGEEIQTILRAAMPDVSVNVEPGGEYDFTTEDGTTAAMIAADIKYLFPVSDNEDGADANYDGLP